MNAIAIEPSTGQTVDLTGLTQEEILYALVIAHTDPVRFNGFSVFDCAINQTAEAFGWDRREARSSQDRFDLLAAHGINPEEAHALFGAAANYGRGPSAFQSFLGMARDYLELDEDGRSIWKEDEVT